MKTVSLEAFYEMLERHDWFWVFADNNGVYRDGQDAESKLAAIAKAGGPEHERLLHEYHDHVWSGPTWNNEKLPKPAKPQKT